MKELEIVNEIGRINSKAGFRTHMYNHYFPGVYRIERIVDKFIFRINIISRHLLGDIR